ncbi:hypothetical protein J7426_12470 [Tropicibacter sp. R16_0]|uniref:hypothetical protein n=1 Tax=Tropicibacter sp. R16_0 TaxID=2821102 RepID=UPI001ADB5FA3|nr:hypothetical protein [Tropicibacter sp. R16_0]MBO9451079.1 hypothetical protein [Tropicibacter sp. R16_0]
MKDYHWFTKAIEDLTNDTVEASDNRAILGLGGVIKTFVEEAKLSQQDLQRLGEISDDLYLKLELADLAPDKVSHLRGLTV